MIKGLVKSRLALALSLALGASSVAYAADTTSAVRGVITGPDGQPAANTKITLMHQPTGTVTEVMTNAQGAFSASGLRVGGPYLVVIDSDKYQDISKDDVYLQLGETLRLNEQLKSAQADETLTVYGSAVAYSQNAGGSSVFSENDIKNAPSFNRDIKDVVRANPLATTLGGTDDPLTVAGQNPRYNSISIDGVGLNDDFGLNSNGYPTQRSPISMDAIEQVSIDVNPFDAKYGGFSGARVNAVTKSGTNEFHGGLFYEKTSDSWTGKAKNPYTGEETDVTGIKSDTYGFNVGGPIIKDKLFFFVNYENYKKPTSVLWGPKNSGAANETYWTEDAYNQVRDITQQKYGVDIGDWNSSPEETNKTMLTKLDWNITDDQRASFSYQRVRGNQVRNQTNSTKPLRPSSNWYNNQQDLDAYALHFYSDWTSDFSTELAVSYKDVKTGAIPGTKAIGTVVIENMSAVDGDKAQIQFGPDVYRHANELETKTWKVDLDGTYLIGDHKLGFGWQYERLDIYNLFAPTSLGQWTFKDIAAYQAGDASSLSYSNAFTNNAQDAAANFVMGTNAFYVQDDWTVRDDVELNMGLRYKRIFNSDKPSFNQNFADRYGFSNQENLDGKGIFMPRIGVKWYATDDLTVRGGIGRFSGGAPNVWISNSYSNDGLTYVDYNKGAVVGDYLSNVDITQVPQNVQDTMVAGDGSVAAVDPSFKIPSSWRANVGFDYKFDIPTLGKDFTWSAEYLRITNKDDLNWVDLNRVDSGKRTSDGRIIYNFRDPSVNGHTDMLLTNADADGHSNIITTSLSKTWDNGLYMTASYAHQDVKEGNAGTSSIASSNYKYNVMVNRNETLMGTGNYEVEHSFKLNLGYSHEFFKGYATKFNMFFSRRSGLPFSWVLDSYKNSGALGDNSYIAKYTNYVPYIPTGADDPNVSYAGGMTYESFMKDVEAAGLSKYAGGYAPKNASRTPWINTMDISVQQELPGFVEGQKGTVYFTVQNFLNMLNKDWGRVTDSQYGTKSLVSAKWDSNGQLVYSPLYNGFDTKQTFETNRSTWYLKLGVRYSF
ncbi:TonB-dependent receptor [Gallaecimonas kandeliae]|uniref:TonB-dependent receptor n=1 Tax=Gallaecimonas kandeliae TaxID=3029055 RepID=UPI002647AFD1|nr:TonB-dependent receptor [Gallaecimonas kandeliae]WKE64884.1 TonB-dependent receptor [Gallaecimonas kandeliae]